MFFHTPKLATLTRAGWTLVSAAGLAVSAQAGPVYLEVSVDGRESRPGLVLAGRPVTLVLALTSAAAEQPELAGDLFATAGGLAAPLFSNRALSLSRVGTPAAGLQRFRFSLDLPASEKTQQLLLRLRVRNGPEGTWLPLPALPLEARPSTWKESLRRFTGRYACGRLAGNERLEKILQAAGAEAGGLAAGAAARVGLAEAGDDPRQLPEVSVAVWMIFKRGAGAEISFGPPAAGGPPVIIVDDRILDRLENDAAAQEIFERALSAAHAFLASSGSNQSPP